MDAHSESLRNALISALTGKTGALRLQRRFVKLRMEKPHLELRAAVAALVSSVKPEKNGATASELRANGVMATTLLDLDYPNMLKNIPDPPLAIFYRGSIQPLHRPCIAIVGARSVTEYGLQTTQKIAGELARLGFTIVSGLALGVDARAHAACLEVKGRTAAVLGSGVDRIYPADHRGLAQTITAEGGVLLSEFPPGTPPTGFHFPIRNRIISGLSHAVIVVEAAEKSGSLITARHCLDQGRELFAVPGPIHYKTAHGTNKLIYSGEARLFLSVASVLEELAPLLGLAADHSRRVGRIIEDPLAKKIYEMLDAFEPVQLDLLVAELKLEAGVVVSKLVLLETLDMVKSRPGQRYVRNPLSIVES